MNNPISGISGVITDYCYLSDGDSNFDSVIKFFTNGVITSDSEWAFLPVQPEEDAFVFYAFFKSDKSLRFFNEVGKASLGGPFISQLRIGTGTANHLNALVARMFSLGYFKFQEVRLDRNNAFVVERLSRLRSVIEKSVDALQPTGVLALSDIRKFRQHLVNGEFQLAQDVLNQIAATGRLSSVNYLFLELQLMQKMGRDQEIWNHPSINEFVVTARPRAVTELLLESLWNYLSTSLTSGEISGIDDLYIQRMVKLLAGIRTPHSESGRICLAIVLALSAVNDALSNYDIPSGELLFLQSIIDTKTIPVPLKPVVDISATKYVYDFSQLSEDQVNTVRQELVDDGDARGLLCLLAHLRSKALPLESTLKNIVSVVEGEYLVELAVDVVSEVNGSLVETTGWTNNLQKKWSKVQFMAQVFQDGFVGVGTYLDSSVMAVDAAFRVHVLEECFQSWAITHFHDFGADKSFSELVRNSEHITLLKPGLADLLIRLVENGIGAQTQKAIQEVLD